MATFQIEILETCTTLVEVEAGTLEEAFSKVRTSYNAGEIDMSDPNANWTEFQEFVPE